MMPNAESTHDNSDRDEELEDGTDAPSAADGMWHSPEPNDEQVILDRLERMGLALDRALVAFRKEHHTDHRLLLSILTDQNARIRGVERALRSARSAPAP